MSNEEGDTGAKDGEVLEEMPQHKDDIGDIEEEEEEEEGMNKSKRVSGQGMERQKENRTPRTKTKRFHNIRAVSTPQVSQTSKSYIIIDHLCIRLTRLCWPPM